MVDAPKAIAVKGARAEQPDGTSTSRIPHRRAHVRHRRVRVGEEHAGGPASCAARWRGHFHNGRRIEPGGLTRPDRPALESSRQGHRDRSVAHRAHAPLATPATYTQASSRLIRDLFAKLVPESQHEAATSQGPLQLQRARGVAARSAGGAGVKLKIEMQFLSDVYRARVRSVSRQPLQSGRPWRSTTRGRSINDVLEMTRRSDALDVLRRTVPAKIRSGSCKTLDRRGPGLHPTGAAERPRCRAVRRSG